MNRRRLLQAAGLTGFASAWAGRRGAAHAAGPPTRLGIFSTDHGVVADGFFFRKGALPTDKAWSFSLADMAESDFSPALRPLWRHRNKLIIIEGLSHYVSFDDKEGDDHARGHLALLTGNRGVSTFDGVKSLAASASLDQIVASALRKREASLTEFTSVFVGRLNRPFPFHHFVYADRAGAIEKVPLEYDLPKLTSRLFGGVSKGGPTPPSLVTANQGSVLDLVKSETVRLSANLSASDKRRLSAHQDLVRDLENTIQRLATLQCEGPAPVEVGIGWNGDDIPHYTAANQAIVRLAAAAFACDLTRVFHFRQFEVPKSMLGAKGDLHNDYAHRANVEPGAKVVMQKYDRMNMDDLAKWADALDAMPNGAGGTLLDSSVLFWGSELADGNHAHAPWPAILVGGANGAFRTGQYHFFPNELRFPASAPSYTDDRRVGKPHNHLLVSLAQAMGVSIDRVGLASIQGKDGPVSLEGRLEVLHR